MARGFGPGALARVTADMDPAMLSLARRNDSMARGDAWGRPQGWAVIARNRPPNLGFGVLWYEDAKRVNAIMPSDEDVLAARPFVLKARTEAERARAVHCLTQAIYYEAALEPTEGQQAVAQTVLNRLRHPEYPKSVCGVIYEGSDRFTGCQFSFTCDGSLFRQPDAFYWAKARAVAMAALDGFVMKAVGTTTHYHADYVFPRWGATLVRIRQLGAHIFYRFPGPAGSLEAFTRPYRGNELSVSLTPRERPADEVPPGVEIVKIPDPLAPGGFIERRAGVIKPTRRAPTPDEVAAINAALADLPQAASAAPPPEPTGVFSSDLPITPR